MVRYSFNLIKQRKLKIPLTTFFIETFPVSFSCLYLLLQTVPKPVVRLKHKLSEDVFIAANERKKSECI